MALNTEHVSILRRRAPRTHYDSELYTGSSWVETWPQVPFSSNVCVCVGVFSVFFFFLILEMGCVPG